MFTGIIESTGLVTGIQKEGNNVHFTLASPISHELKIDQSLCHDGVCLTVVAVGDGRHTVTAVTETLKRSNLDTWQIGKLVNLERALPANGRLDGHLVQGHVDAIAVVAGIREAGGSWYFRFEYRKGAGQILVDKGSIAVNGVSLTVVEPGDHDFSVAIIPYTFEHTNFKTLQTGRAVNLEFDIIGKYLAKLALPYLHAK